MNSASAATFISDQSVGAACRRLQAATARKAKNGLHRPPLLKSLLGRRGRGRSKGGGKQSGEEGPEEGGPGSSDAARLAAAH